MKRLLLSLALVALSACLGACFGPAGGDPTRIEPIIEPIVTAENSTAPHSATPGPTPSPARPLPTVSIEPIYEYKVKEFFPTENYYLSYETADGLTLESFCEYRRERQGQDLVQRRLRIKGKQDGKPFIRTTAFDGQRICEVFDRKSTGFTYDFTSWAKLEGADILLQEPIELGESWKVDAGTSTITAVGKLVELPVGELRVVEVTTQYDDNSRREMLFYSKVGLVAEYHYDAEGQLTASERLAEYESDRNDKQIIRFYFADRSEPGRLVYIPRTVPIEKNQSMERVFRDYLQRKSGNTLVTLGDDIDINKITLKDGAVRVDFSVQMAEMATRSELRPELERGFLQALANTFGSYYQVERIYLDIEGEPYYSRNFAALSDDHWTLQLDGIQEVAN